MEEGELPLELVRVGVGEGEGEPLALLLVRGDEGEKVIEAPCPWLGLPVGLPMALGV